MNELSGSVKRITNVLLILSMVGCIVISLSACGSDDDGSLAPYNVAMFVTNIFGNSVTSYQRTDNGNVAPRSIIATEDQPMGVAVDSVNNEIFVTNPGAGRVTVYAKNASGDATPIRTIAGSMTQLLFPSGIAVDTVNNEIFVTNPADNSITVYPRDASGDVAPIRTIAGSATDLASPTGIAVDTMNNEIFVMNQLWVATAGETAPASQSVAASLNSHYVVTVYARVANGNVAPVRTIGDITTSGNAREVFWYSGIALDLVHGEIFVVDNWGPAYSIDVYPRDANGNVAPVRRISVNATGLVRPSGVAVDPAGNEIFITNEDVDGASSINVYPENANGNIAPARVITGHATALTGPIAISLATE